MTCFNLLGSLRCLVLGAISATMLLGDRAEAQTVGVTFQANDGDLTISGRLLSISDEAFVVSTQAGGITLLPEDVTCTSKACPVVGQAVDQDIPAQLRRISLSSLNKQIDVQGDLLGLSEDHFFVDVNGLGVVSFERRGLRCSGPGCLVKTAMIAPSVPVAPEVPEASVLPLQIVGPRDLTEGILADLLMGYAQDVSPTIEMQRLSQSTYALPFDKDIGTFFVGGTGPSVAFGALAAGAADFVITGRHPNAVEIAALMNADLGDLRGGVHETVIAVDGLVIATHPDLDIPQLTIPQLAAIYSGGISNWSAVGGPDQPITTLTREPGSDENALFGKAVFGDPQMRFERGAVIASSTQEMSDLIASDPFAIGFLWNARSENLNQVDVLGSCGLANLSDPFSLKAGDGIMGARLYLYANPATISDRGDGFIRYAAGGSALPVLDKVGLINPQIERVPLSQMRKPLDTSKLEAGLQAEIGSQLAAQIGNWDRLSTTFRYDETGQILDPMAVSDMGRLVAYLADLPERVDLAVIGFAAADEQFETSVAKSQAIAKNAAETLAERAEGKVSGISIGYAGYGSLSPLFCDSDFGGRALNQRVEIWVRDARP